MSGDDRDWQEVFLVSSGCRPQMLVNILQCTGQPQPPQQQRLIQPGIPVVLRLRNPALGVPPPPRHLWTPRRHLVFLPTYPGARSELPTALGGDWESEF